MITHVEVCVSTDSSEVGIKMVIRVVLYARVSTENQMEKGTAETQFNVLRVEVQKAGNRKVVAEIKDEGYSGDTLPETRPGITKIFDMCEQDLFDELWIQYRDRLSRDTDIAGMIRGPIVKRHRKQIVSLDDTIDKTVNKFKDLISEMELDKYREKRVIGVERAIQDGRAITNPPFGYKIDRESRKLIVDIKVRPIIQEIYNEYYKEKMSIRKIAQKYNLSLYIIKKIITDPIYTDGSVKWGGRIIYNIEPVIEKKDETLEN